MGLRVVEVYEGEPEHHAPALARELVRLGVDVAVVAPPEATGAFAGTGAQVSELAVGASIGSVAGLRRLLRGDVLHAHGLRAAVAVTLARSGGTPMVVSLTNPPAANGASVLIPRAVLPAAAAVLAPTPAVAEVATGLGARGVRVISPPLADLPDVRHGSEQVREELALPASGPIVLASAPLVPTARLDVLVEAAARWRRRDERPQVVLAGVGPAYRALVAQATLARAPVTFAGDRMEVPVADALIADVEPVTHVEPVTGAETTVTEVEPMVAEDRASLADLLAAATVAVVTDPRARPGFALAAVRAGVALAVPAGGVVAELLGDAAVAVPPGDADALDEAVQRLLDDPAARARLSAAARELASRWPDPAAVAAELAGIYERVSSTTRTPVSGGDDTPGEVR